MRDEHLVDVNPEATEHQGAGIGGGSGWRWSGPWRSRAGPGFCARYQARWRARHSGRSSRRFPALPVESIGFDKLAANYPASSSSHRSAFGRADESSAHTAVFFVVSGCVLYALLCGIVGRCIAGAGYVGNWGALELIWP